MESNKILSTGNSQDLEDGLALMELGVQGNVTEISKVFGQASVIW